METTIPTPTMAQQIAHVAIAFQQQRTGHSPKAVTVVLSEDTLVVTLHSALSPAEQVLAQESRGRLAGAGVPSRTVRQLL